MTAQRQRHRAERRRCAGSALAELPRGARLYAAGRHRRRACVLVDGRSAFANPDVEVLAAIRPGLLTTQGPLVLASSALCAARRTVGQFQQALRPGRRARSIGRPRHHPRPQSHRARGLDRARVGTRPPRVTLAEYLAEFSADVEGFVTLEVVRGLPSAIIASCRRSPPSLSRVRRSGRRLRHRSVHPGCRSSRPRRQLRRHRCSARTQAAVLARCRRRRVLRPAEVLPRYGGAAATALPAASPPRRSTVTAFATARGSHQVRCSTSICCRC